MPRLATIPGVVPGLYDRPRGCLFAPRCADATAHARAVRPLLRAWGDGKLRCHYPLDDPQRTADIARDGPVSRRIENEGGNSGGNDGGNDGGNGGGNDSNGAPR